MCEACEIKPADQVSDQKRRLWEIDNNWHCSIVGTCLTLGDLRRIARKLGYKPPDDPYYDVDAYLHGYFVKLCGKPTIAGKMIEKLLNRRHATAVKKFRKLETVEELAEAWKRSFKEGDVPGPYWAVVSHPALDLRLGSKVYNDVHMLSHLVGASNRAALSNLTRLEEDLAEAQELIAQTRTRSIQKLQEKDARILALESQIASLSGRLEGAEAERDRYQRAATVQLETSTHRPTLDSQQERMDQLRRENEALSKEMERYDALVPALQGEIAALERTLSPANCPRSQDCAFDCDLRDRCILYVGGRTRHVGQMRNMVNDWNGTLLHHDGGLEQSLEELASAVSKADLVFFPTDCVSHKAMYRLKDLCKQTVKTYVPLRTSSVSSFLDGLQKTLPDDPLLSTEETLQ